MIENVEVYVFRSRCFYIGLFVAVGGLEPPTSAGWLLPYSTI